MPIARCIQTLLLSGVLVWQAATAASPAPSFEPATVFVGHSEGKGELRLLAGKRRPFTVASVGTMQSDGRMLLEQDVRFDGKAATTRSWVMWQTSPGHYAATLTGAAGPVVGHTEGRRLTLRYRLNRWGLVMHQTLDLATDGQTVDNAGTIRFLGIPVGQLRETIRLEH